MTGTTTSHRTLEEIEHDFARLEPSPRDAGTLELIVRRTAADAREVLESAELDEHEGLVGDKWRADALAYGTVDPDEQITLMNARIIGAIAGEREHWAPAGDQLFVDLDLGAANLPPGTRLALGTAILEVSAVPHTGCSEFARRFGADALRFLSVPDRRDEHRRGIYARVVQPGVVRVGDIVRKIGSSMGDGEVHSRETTMDDSALTAALVSQYQAALAMFRNAVGALPAARWDDPADRNATWRIAYHVLFFTQLYLSGSEQAFEPWIAEDPTTFDEPFELPAGAPARTVEQMLAYADAIEAMLPALVPVTAYDGPSGFSWISISRFEHHLYNIRHLQHHTGQIAERARASGGDGLAWTGRGTAARVFG